jgi:hypothetical protein
MKRIAITESATLAAVNPLLASLTTQLTAITAQRDGLLRCMKTIAEHSGAHGDFPHSLENIQVQNNKYEFTGEVKVEFGVTLKQIRALDAIGFDPAGTVGGWIETEKNLSVYDNAWVYNNAQVSGNARVSGYAQVYAYARVFGSAHVSDNARVKKCLLTATRSDGFTFACFGQKNGPVVIIAGCRFFTIPEAREHWTKTRGGTALGKESLALIDFLERMSVIQKLDTAALSTQNEGEK